MSDVDLEDLIAGYVRALDEALRRAGRPTQPLVDEATAHLLEDAARIARAEGCDDAEAARRAIARFGSVAEVVAAVRKNARVGAARIARGSSIVLLAAMLFVTLRDALTYDGAMGWPLVGGHCETPAWLALLAELSLVSVVLWRALARGRAPRWLPIALQLNTGAAGALLVVYFALGIPLHIRAAMHVSVYHIMSLAPPLWVLMSLQGFAGLQALAPSREAVNAPQG